MEALKKRTRLPPIGQSFGEDEDRNGVYICHFYFLDQSFLYISLAEDGDFAAHPTRRFLPPKNDLFGGVTVLTPPTPEAHARELLQDTQNTDTLAETICIWYEGSHRKLQQQLPTNARAGIGVYNAADLREVQKGSQS